MDLKKIINNQSGYTMFELLVALAIMIIISTLIVVQIQVKDVDRVKIVTERLVSDLRQVRNLVTARVADLSGNFPAGGYGIVFDSTVQPNQYILFGDDDDDGVYNPVNDSLVSQITVEDEDVLIYPQLAPADLNFSIIFKNEHEIITDVASSPGDNYPLEIMMPTADQKGVISIYDLSLDGYTWGNIQVTYENN